MRRLPVIKQGPDDEHRPWERPRTRGDCQAGPRPCPWVSCRHHLYLDLVRGEVKVNRPDCQPEDLRDSCALDVAERDGVPRGDVAEMLGISPERVRQLEDSGLKRMRAARVLEVPEDASAVESLDDDRTWSSKEWALRDWPDWRL